MTPVIHKMNCLDECLETTDYHTYILFHISCERHYSQGTYMSSTLNTMDPKVYIYL